MNGYIAFWKGKKTEVNANTAYEAQEKAAYIFGKRCNRWDVTVVVAEIAGKQVVHSTNSL
jgi:hypothetical protein